MQAEKREKWASTGMEFYLNKEIDVIQHARRKMVLGYQDRSNHHLLVFALFRVHIASGGAPTTLGRSTPSCGRLVVRFRVLKNAELRSAGQTSHGARGSYIVIELVVIILVKLIEVVIVLQQIILEGFASEVVNGTRNYLCCMSSVAIRRTKQLHLFLQIFADLVIYLQFFFDLLKIFLVKVLVIRGRSGGRKEVEEGVSWFCFAHQAGSVRV